MARRRVLVALVKVDIVSLRALIVIFSFAPILSFSAGAAACMAVCLTHPIDQTKIRSQTSAVRQTVLQTAHTSIQSGGVSGLWIGLSASLLRQCMYGAARFGIYGWLKDTNGSRVPLWVNGAVAGIVAGVVGAPAGKFQVQSARIASIPFQKLTFFFSPFLDDVL